MQSFITLHLTRERERERQTEKQTCLNNYDSLSNHLMCCASCKYGYKFMHTVY